MRLHPSPGLMLLPLLLFAGPAAADGVTLTILHTNDLHAHIEPVEIKGRSYGGYARHATLVHKYRESDPNVLVLSGGDTFQGTLYFHVYQGLADLFFLNEMRYDAMAVGNHEFDRGPTVLGIFARNARFPLLSANLDVSEEPALAELVLPHAEVTVAGTRVGLVGAVTPELPELSSPGEHVHMKDLVPALQSSVDALTRDGVEIVILLSHLGLMVEQDVVRQVRGVDFVVGGHSHTFLGEFADPNVPKSDGPYPIVLADPDGHTVLQVSSGEWGIVLGRIQVDFDEAGHVERWHDAAPIVVDESVPEDPTARDAILALASPIQTMRRMVVTESKSGFAAAREDVRRRECPLGNVVADAMLWATRNASSRIALMNGGGIRTSLAAGPITYENLVAVQPFGGSIVVLDLTGQEILSALEHGVSGWDEAKGGFLHVSHGFHYAFDLARPAGSRVVSASLEGTPLDPGATYRVVTNGFLARGGDGHATLQTAAGKRMDTGFIDVEVLADYLREYPGLETGLEGRVEIQNESR